MELTHVTPHQPELNEDTKELLEVGIAVVGAVVAVWLLRKPVVIPTPPQ